MHLIFKLVYIASFGCGVVGCVVAANAKSIGVLIGMRVIQGAGCVNPSIYKNDGSLDNQSRCI